MSVASSIELIAVVSGFGGYQTHRLWEVVPVDDNQPVRYQVDTETIESEATEPNETKTISTNSCREFEFCADAWTFIGKSLGYVVR
jgi:hypothetical protein